VESALRDVSKDEFPTGSEKTDYHAYLGQSRWEKKAVHRLLRELEEKKAWVGPYNDDTYTWGRLSGSRTIDLILLAAMALTALLLLEILRHSTGPW